VYGNIYNSHFVNRVDVDVLSVRKTKREVKKYSDELYIRDEEMDKVWLPLLWFRFDDILFHQRK